MKDEVAPLPLFPGEECPGGKLCEVSSIGGVPFQVSNSKLRGDFAHGA